MEAGVSHDTPEPTDVPDPPVDASTGEAFEADDESMRGPTMVVSVTSRRLIYLDHMDEHLEAAMQLGMEHAASGKRLYAGKQVAAALKIGEVLAGEQYVALRDAYERGLENYW